METGDGGQRIRRKEKLVIVLAGTLLDCELNISPNYGSLTIVWRSDVRVTLTIATTNARIPRGDRESGHLSR